MIEIIRAGRSIIPAMELTFLSLHMYLYSKEEIRCDQGGVVVIVKKFIISMKVAKILKVSTKIISGVILLISKKKLLENVSD